MMKITEILSTSQKVAIAKRFSEKPFPTGTQKVDACPLCGSDERNEDVLGNDTNWALCNACGAGYKTLIPTDDELHQFYKVDYWENESNKLYPTRKDVRTQVIRVGRQCHLIQQELLVVESSLDIGCAMGWGVHSLASMGINAFGVEPSDRCRALAEALNVYENLESLPRREFDLVILSHVLEHVPQPIEYLKMLYDEYMSEVSTILIEIPDGSAGSAWSSFHTVMIPPKVLSSVLERAGFVTINAGRSSHVIQMVGRKVGPDAKEFIKRKYPGSKFDE
jgi:hypothetical protein